LFRTGLDLTEDEFDQVYLKKEPEKRRTNLAEKENKFCKST
jgi:hypothetical protein